MLHECPDCWLCASGNLHRGRAKGIALTLPPPWLEHALAAVVAAAGGSTPRLFAAARLGGSIAQALPPRTIVVATDELADLTATLWRLHVRPITVLTPPAHVVTYGEWELEVAQAILAHELGHVRSFEAGDYSRGPAVEAAADEFAGRVLARVAARTPAAEGLFHAIGCRTLFCTHPRPHERRDAFRRGQHSETVTMVYEAFSVGY